MASISTISFTLDVILCLPFLAESLVSEWRRRAGCLSCPLFSCLDSVLQVSKSLKATRSGRESVYGYLYPRLVVKLFLSGMLTYSLLVFRCHLHSDLRTPRRFRQARRTTRRLDGLKTLTEEMDAIEEENLESDMGSSGSVDPVVELAFKV